MKEPGANTRKIISVALLIFVILTILIVVVLPLRSLYSYRSERIASLQNEYQQFSMLSDARGELQSRADQLSSLREEKGYFLQSKNGALAAAELQAYVKKTIAASGGRLLSTQPIASSVSDTLQPIQVRVRMQGGMDVLKDTFYLLEAGSPTVVLENIVLTQTSAAKQYSKNQTEGAISISFDIIGFIKVT